MPTLAPQSLLSLATAVFRACGSPPAEARTVAEHLVTADLMGISSHGLARLPQYVGDVSKGSIVPGAEILVTHETPTTAIVDGQWNFGQVSAVRATQLAVAKASAHRLGCCVLRRCRHAGRLGAYTQCAAEQGLVALAGAAAGPEGHWVAPFGGAQGRLGTNPLSFAAPTGGRPVLLDFSTSMAPEGRVRHFRQLGLTLPEPWLVDRDGRPSRDPADLYDHAGDRAGAILPFGGTQGYKGYGLALMVGILASALGDPVWAATGIERHTNGLWLLVLDPAAFAETRGAFAAQVSALLEYVTSARSADGSGGPLWPGQIEFASLEHRQRHGIPLEPEIWQRIATCAGELGVAMPQPPP